MRLRLLTEASLSLSKLGGWDTEVSGNRLGSQRCRSLIRARCKGKSGRRTFISLPEGHNTSGAPGRSHERVLLGQTSTPSATRGGLTPTEPRREVVGNDMWGWCGVTRFACGCAHSHVVICHDVTLPYIVPLLFSGTSRPHTSTFAFHLSTELAPGPALVRL